MTICRKAFTFQNIYVGQNPYEAPALFSMLPAAELTEGSLFPVGGMFSRYHRNWSLLPRNPACVLFIMHP